jgi:hypothetical protein
MALPTLTLPPHIPLASHVIIGTCDFSAAGSRACLAMGLVQRVDAAPAGAFTLLSAPVSMAAGDAPLRGAHASAILFGRAHADSQSAPAYVATLVDAASGLPIVRRVSSHCTAIVPFPFIADHTIHFQRLSVFLRVARLAGVADCIQRSARCARCNGRRVCPRQPPGRIGSRPRRCRRRHLDAVDATARGRLARGAHAMHV